MIGEEEGEGEKEDTALDERIAEDQGKEDDALDRMIQEGKGEEDH